MGEMLRRRSAWCISLLASACLLACILVPGASPPPADEAMPFERSPGPRRPPPHVPPAWATDFMAARHWRPAWFNRDGGGAPVGVTVGFQGPFRIVDASAGRGREILRAGSCVDVLYLDGSDVADREVESIVARTGPLHVLSLAGTRVSDECLPSVAKRCRWALSLSRTRVTGDGLRWFSPGGGPLILDMSFNRISRAGVRELAGLGASQLDLTGASIGDESLEDLAKMRNLWILHLGGTAVTDDGVARFVQDAASKQLLLVDVSGTAVTADGARRAQSMRPGAFVKH